MPLPTPPTKKSQSRQENFTLSMFGSFYRLTILYKQGNTVGLKIHNLTDENYIPFKKNFAFQILVEMWWKMLQGYFLQEESYLPLESANAKKLALTHPFFAEMKWCWEDIMSTRESISNKEYERMIKQKIIDLAQHYIVTMKLADLRNFPWCPQDYKSYCLENVPQVNMIVTVSDPRLLHHVIVDTWWESMLYEF